MTTNILALPLLSFSMTVGTNEDWTDAWSYLDASGNPISLAGLTLNFMLRRTPDDAAAALIASTGPTVNGLPVQGGIAVTANTVGLSILAAAMSRVAPNTYTWELQAIGDGAQRSIGTGLVTVNRGIVR